MILGVSDFIVILMTIHRLQTLSKIARFGQKPECDLKVRKETLTLNPLVLVSLISFL